MTAERPAGVLMTGGTGIATVWPEFAGAGAEGEAQ
jgi:hypothetical protein